MSLDITLYGKMDTGNGPEEIEVYSSNITHNLGRMAREAGFYAEVWRPEENAIEYAEQLIEPLTSGLAALNKRPEFFEQFSAENGWGTREQFVPWLEQLLKACTRHPKATIRSCR